MSKTLKLITAFLIINTAAFSQKKDSALRLGESRESNYSCIPRCDMVKEELYYIFVYGDSLMSRHHKRVFSVSISGDTATIEANKLSETIRDFRWIRIGDMLFKKEEITDTLSPFKWQW